jgi:uncharacterized protein (TIGR00725 family)
VTHGGEDAPSAARALRVAVVGAAEATPDEYETARALGRLLAQAGVLVVCGGRTGVMEAVARGAVEGGGQTVGILPGPDGAEANPWVGVPIATGLGEARNAIVVRCAEAVVGVGGGWGTLSELSLAAKMGVPVSTVGSGPHGLRGITAHHDAQRAAAWATQAASGYRSREE